MASLNVKRQEPTLITPAEQTPKGLHFLSNLDHNFPFFVCTIYCFKSESRGNEEAAKVIKNALSKALVHYYPLAGRLTISSDRKLAVDCTAESAVFVEAEAECSIEEIGDVRKPDPDILGKLVYDIPAATNILQAPPLFAQCSAGELLEKALSYGVGLVQKAVKMITDGYVRSSIDYLEVKRGRYSLAWSRLNFQLTDLGLGLGEPVFEGPVSLPNQKNMVIIFLSMGKDHIKGINVLLNLPTRDQKAK